MIPIQELERVTVQAYNQFYVNHRELFKTNPLQYWREASTYKELEVRKYIIGNK